MPRMTRRRTPQLNAKDKEEEAPSLTPRTRRRRRPIQGRGERTPRRERDIQSRGKPFPILPTPNTPFPFPHTPSLSLLQPQHPLPSLMMLTPTPSSWTTSLHHHPQSTLCINIPKPTEKGQGKPSTTLSSSRSTAQFYRLFSWASALAAPTTNQDKGG
jgi:hypothetical protein